MKNPLSSQDEQILPYIRDGTFPIIVAFSGGKDSIAMVLYLLEQAIDRRRIHLHHHDVDGGGPNLFDWPCTKSYCKAFADAMGLSLFFSCREGGIYREIFRNSEPRQDILYQREPAGRFFRIPSDKTAINTRLKFPAVSSNLLTRWCSSTVKIDVLHSVVADHPLYQHCLVVLTGERREESPARSRYLDIELYKANTKTRKAIHWRPILEWPESAVWEIISRWHIQPHPAYMLGWSRCSCQMCIFSDPDIWATIASIDAGKIKKIAATERRLHFTLYAQRNILETVAAGNPLEDLDPFWVDQALNHFNAPIILSDWQLPKGAFRKEAAGAL